MSTFTPYSAAVGGALIGLAAVLLMVATGRIAGVSGFVSRLLPPYEDRQTVVRLAFVTGLILAPVLYSVGIGHSVNIAVSSSLSVLLVAGFLVGLGAVLGGGCTSGHGVCGTARLSSRSLIATPVFVGAGMITVFVVRHVLGGQ
ncbi:YeeE/YedE family protein [Hyphomicrobium sp.]|uniref:YeeE/YedE family protein n=1 Tax=Hyphomicrobium sp. TaxID=82 RepID=UPI002E352F3B|nr:YeeE/YedE thiosulfate transporter family protein [Hyphomicrobium sp.]HEX2841852.1 YeeE/YedE thiosulfate transporter family protein [Hyphomicrobium sp.]